MICKIITDTDRVSKILSDGKFYEPYKTRYLNTIRNTQLQY